MQRASARGDSGEVSRFIVETGRQNLRTAGAAVSRIWKALKQAEKVRSRSKEHKQAGHSPAHPYADQGEHSPAHSQAHPNSDGADRRRSERWEQPVPVLVYGSDSGKHPFHEQTETADI